jgi:hypothetical protein
MILDRIMDMGATNLLSSAHKIKGTYSNLFNAMRQYDIA